MNPPVARMAGGAAPRAVPDLDFVRNQYKGCEETIDKCGTWPGPNDTVCEYVFTPTAEL